MSFFHIFLCIDDEDNRRPSRLHATRSDLGITTSFHACRSSLSIRVLNGLTRSNFRATVPQFKSAADDMLDANNSDQIQHESRACMHSREQRMVSEPSGVHS
jgi:hypothetical protein